MKGPPRSTNLLDLVVVVRVDKRECSVFDGIIVHYLLRSVLVAAKTSEIFLVSGQYLRRVGGVKQLAPEIEQCVVVARGHIAAYDALAVSDPAFRPLGNATLQDYESAARKLRAVLEGERSDLKVLRSTAGTETGHVFLASGQTLQRVGVAQRLADEVEQYVVVAPDLQSAYGVLAANDPDFKTIGLVSLEDYERAAGKLRAAVRGDDVGWKVLVASGM